MRKSRILGAIGLAAVAALTLSACNSGSPDAGGAGGGSTEGSGADGELFTVATDVKLEGSPTFDAIKKRDKVVVGVKEDQPNLGYLDATTNERSGFDVDIARWVAASLGYDESKIEYKAIASANREQSIVNGDIDYYVGTYSITDKRKQQIGFAGPYFITGQGLLVKKDSDITGIDDMKGKTVCSATGSTPIQNIKDNYKDIKTKEYDLYSACVEDLINGQVDAVTTDEAILIGYAAKYPDDIKVVGKPFSEERYGIGLAKDDTALKDFINTMLTDGHDTWQKIYDANLGSSGTKVDQPKVDAD